MASSCESIPELMYFPLSCTKLTMFMQCSLNIILNDRQNIRQYFSNIGGIDSNKKNYNTQNG